MRIGIVGGGAIGLLFATYLIEAGNEVTIYTRRQEQGTQLQQVGVTRLPEDYFSVQATSMKEVIEEDVLFVAVKQYSLKNMEQVLRHAKCKTIIFLQNGMGHIPLLRSLPQENIAVGIVEHGALKHSDTSVEHSGIGRVSLGVIRGNVDCIVSSISLEKFSFVVLNNWEEIILDKLIVNSVINPLTAVYKVPNGELLTDEVYYSMMEKLFNEVYLAVGSGDRQRHWERVCDICLRTERNRSSMLRDVENNRETEIDFILGYIIDEAKKKGVLLPVSSSLYQEIKEMKNNNGRETKGESTDGDKRIVPSDY